MAQATQENRPLAAEANSAGRSCFGWLLRGFRGFKFKEFKGF